VALWAASHCRTLLLGGGAKKLPMLYIAAPHALQFFCGLSGLAPGSAFFIWRRTLNILRQSKQTHLSLNLRTIITSLPGNSHLTSER
jgi:hypothetical protein